MLYYTMTGEETLNIPIPPALPESINLINQRYLTSRADTFYITDITYFSKRFPVLFVLDLSPKAILRHRIHDRPLTAQYVLDLLEIILQARRYTDHLILNSYKPKGKRRTFLHSDNCSVFKNQIIQYFAAKLNII
jgi:transposase InsO family protein